MDELAKYLRVGFIARPHGVTGAVKLDPLSDDIRRYAHLKSAYIERGGEYTPVTVSNVGAKDDAVYMTLSCSTSREDAEKLRGAFLCVDRAHAMPLPEDTYFVTDVIGCEAETDKGEKLGRVTDVIETGANDVYEIHGARTLMLPALKRVLITVDIAARKIVVDSGVLEEVGLFED